jgi:hypothetical protein
MLRGRPGRRRAGPVGFRPQVRLSRRTLDGQVLLITGNDPHEAEFGPVYAAVAPNDGTPWSVLDAGHIQALSGHPEEYRRWVLSTLESALLAL